MFMRHFGHRVGHQQYRKQQEETEMGPVEGNANLDDTEIDLNDVNVDNSDKESEGEEELATGSNGDSDDCSDEGGDSDDLGYASF